MYAKVQEPRTNGGPNVVVSGSARPGAMAMEVNGRAAGQPPFAIRLVYELISAGCCIVKKPSSSSNINKNNNINRNNNTNKNKHQQNQYQ